MEDKRLCKAQESVWHQTDRQLGRIPAILRHRATDATWSKRGYHGWVYGYGCPMTCHAFAVPVWIQIETAAVSEVDGLAQKEPVLLEQICPATLSGDNADTKATRIRRWAPHGVVLLTPALQGVNGRFAQAYPRFIKQPPNACRLQQRRTMIEPLFD